MTQQINRQAIRIGSVRDVGLTADQQRELRRVYAVVGPCLQSTFDILEADFRRELFPHREIRIWTQIAAAFGRFRELHPAATSDELMLAVRPLVLISSGVPGHSKMPDALFEELARLYASL